jgi:hypothetical protein
MPVPASGRPARWTTTWRQENTNATLAVRRCSHHARPSNPERLALDQERPRGQGPLLVSAVGSIPMRSTESLGEQAGCWRQRHQRETSGMRLSKPEIGPAEWLTRWGQKRHTRLGGNYWAGTQRGPAPARQLRSTTRVRGPLSQVSDRYSVRSGQRAAKKALSPRASSAVLPNNR